MCVIASIPAGAGRLSDDILATMWQRNPDGAGIMYAADGRVWGHKGLMTLDALRAAVAAVPDGAPLVIHCRIATSGGISPEMTHPFPVSRRLRRLRALDWTADIGIAHNGIIAGFGGKEISDTADFARSVACPLLHSDIAERAIEKTIAAATYGSRLAIMYGDGHVIHTGDWVKDGGILFSNETYKKRLAIWPDYDKMDSWEDDIVPLWGEDCYIISSAGDLDDPDEYGVDFGGKVYSWTRGGTWRKRDGYRAYTTTGQTLTADRLLYADCYNW